MCVQECNEVRPNDNAGTSARHRTWCALVDLDGISDTSKGNARAEASDGAPHNDDAVRALVPRLTQCRSPRTDSRIALAMSSARWAPEKSGRPLASTVGTPLMPSRWSASSS